MRRVTLALIVGTAQSIGITPPAQPPPVDTPPGIPHRCRVLADSRHIGPPFSFLPFKFLYVRLAPGCRPGGYAEVVFVNPALNERIPSRGERFVLNQNVPSVRLPPPFARGGVWIGWKTYWYSDDGRMWPVPEREAALP